MTRDEYADAWDLARQIRGNVDGLPSFEAIERGGIVGSVELVDCVTASDSRWFFGKYGFLLRDPQGLPFNPCRGQLGFFDIPEAHV